VVLENAAYGYKRPNILDVKLGVRLWADDAPLEKKQRFDKISGATTHADLGFRIAGMRVYQGSETKKELDEEDYRIYDKDFGRYGVHSGNVVDSFRKFIFNDSAHIDEELGRTVAHAFMEDLKRVQETLEREESRMYSASLLFIFEGDGDALRAAVDQTSASAAASQKDKYEANIPSAARVDSGIAMDEDGELVLPGDDDFFDDEMSLPPIYSLKLIDFAHAKWTPGLGPDENNLKGVRSLVRIFDELSR
jgi:1D-myo-inositol-tetrakisphosphate 5-kinase/inositol-polyphosphate multikinase